MRRTWAGTWGGMMAGWVMAGGVLAGGLVPGAAALAQTLSPPPAPLGTTVAPASTPGQAVPGPAIPAPAKLATKLPEPALPEGAPVLAYLKAARNALDTNDVRLARGALELAETRALTRSVRPSRARDPAKGGLVGAISATRAALGRGDWAGANAALARAMALATKGQAKPG